MARFNTNANETEKIAYFESKFTEWIRTITTLLQEDQDLKKEKPDGIYYLFLFLFLIKTKIFIFFFNISINKINKIIRWTSHRIRILENQNAKDN